MAVDEEILGAIFAARIYIAKGTADEAAAEAREEHKRTVAWIRKNDRSEGSFIWYCSRFDLEPSAVRRLIDEANPLPPSIANPACH